MFARARKVGREPHLAIEQLQESISQCASSHEHTRSICVLQRTYLGSQPLTAQLVRRQRRRMGALLQSAVRSRHLARGLRKEECLRALQLWRALVAGRWSLVDHVDRDGKRFVLARRNAANVREPSDLTPNERLVALYAASGHTNALIAYELGLSPATTSGLLRSAMRKLRVKSAAELAQLFTSRAWD